MSSEPSTLPLVLARGRGVHPFFARFARFDLGLELDSAEVRGALAMLVLHAGKLLIRAFLGSQVS